MKNLATDFFNAKMGITQSEPIEFAFTITGAKASTAKVPGYPVLTTYDAIGAQSTIDNFLGTTNEFLISQFDATAMGNDMFGGIVNLWGGSNLNPATTSNPAPGQAAALDWFTAECLSSSGTVSVRTGAGSSSTLTASTLITECARGANGNLAFKCNFGNTPDFDALTSGLIIVRFMFRSK